MKYTLALTFCLVFSMGFSQDSYDSLWKEVETLEKEGLTQSALKKVQFIASKAEKENNKVQRIKTLLYESKYALVLEEDAQLSIANNFKKRIENSVSPEKNMLQNLLANLYWQYFQQNRYRFYDRTNTGEKVDDTDFRTWDLETLFGEIDNLFKASLKNEKTLQAIDLSTIKELLIIKEESREFHPTLYDFLSHNALNFYQTDESSITQPAYKFEIDNPDYLCQAEMFSKMVLTSEDSTSTLLQALKIYQNLTQFHLNDKSPEALTQLNIERLRFVKQNARFDAVDSLYLETLQNEKNKFNDPNNIAPYDFEIAYLYYQQGRQYTEETPEHRWKLKEAIEICNRVMANAPKTTAAKNCESLKMQIEQVSLQVQAENFIPVQQHSRVLVTYKNLPSLEFKIYEFSKNQEKKLNEIYDKKEQLKLFNSLKIQEQWTATLPNEGDFQLHTTEVVLPQLPHGTYLVLAKQDNDTFGFKTLQVTSISMTKTDVQDTVIYQFLDRTSGVALSGVKATVTYQEGYNEKTKSQNLTSDTNGNIFFKKNSKYYYNVRVQANHENETAYFNDGYIYGRNQTEKETTNYQGFLFTDRSIYRPGQTVYFKGITIKTENKTSEVLPKESVYVLLYNVNGEEINRLELVTNEYGSASGEFILPNDGLTGQFRIRLLGKKHTLNNSDSYFSVEEYKRPKFETSFNPVTETFKVNDSVTVKGLAQAYAGSNITDAKVVYRVHRKVEYPRWYYWYRPSFYSEAQEITHGETQTNDQGEFEITFKAIPDLSAKAENLPVFHYEITADVTDINGETRSATTSVNVGYHTLTANIISEATIDKTQKENKLTIATQNLNGQDVNATGTVSIYKLQAPEHVSRPRPWQAPDYQTLSKDEFKALFPHDPYKDENNPNTWEKGEQVLKKSFDTGKSKDLDLGNMKKWQTGLYKIELVSQDKFGQAVKDQLLVTIFDSKNKSVLDNTLFAASLDKKAYQIGNTVEVSLASAAKNLIVYVEIEKNKTLVSNQKVLLNNEVKTVKIPVDAADLGGFVIHLYYTIYNHFGYQKLDVLVPYPKTDLDIETRTFRDKLQPGQDETWSFKIKGPKGEQVSAELLASMYDASLDQFKPHAWSFDPIYQPIYYSAISKNGRNSFGSGEFISIYLREQFNRTRLLNISQDHEEWNWYGLSFRYGRNYLARGYADGIEVEADNLMATAPMEAEDSTLREEVAFVSKSEKALTYHSLDDKEEAFILSSNTKKENDQGEKSESIQVRKNLHETAFFFPQLQTDNKGNVTFSFTSPEALTKWKLQLLAHTKDLNSSVKTLETVTQKELMVIPNAPRFLREGDNIVISTKIANLSDTALSGQAELQLVDAVTGKDITELLLKPFDKLRVTTQQDFTVNAKGNTQVSWELTIPNNVQAVQYKVIAKAGDFSDGEQNALPVLSNRMLVTETLPMWVRSNETRTFVLDKLKTNTSTTLSNHKLTLEMTSNPAWYAVQALPYLMEYPYECNEQTFSRYYANALASHIANSNPRIQDVFNQWKNSDALLSNLEKNQELKSLLIQETPWLRDAQSETEQKKRIGLLFDLNKMTSERTTAIGKLKRSQLLNGAWPWFNGGRPNRFITQHILTGFGHLKQLNAIQSSSEESQMIQKAMGYLDAEFVEEYKTLKKYNKDVDLTKDHLSYTQLHYLYMRSFFPDIKKSKEVEDITAYYLSQIKSYWLSRNLYAKGMMALITGRAHDKVTSGKILKSLKENSITNDELGMYWKDNTASWYWYQAPIETQALLIEAFSETGLGIQSEAKNLLDIDNMKLWLLKNKQTNQWETTKATTEAVYALLLQGSDWLSITDAVEVMVGNKKIEPSKLDNVAVEAGTGYYKTSWSTNEITQDKATVTLTKTGDGVAWGSLYWQYFEDLDKITSAETPLKLKKKLFLKTNTDKGEQLSEITENTSLKVGDLVKIRIELRSDRDMEFVHMKDMRAAGLEPINVLSQYKWQDGLGYYESTKDAATHFFFDSLPKGVYVFEYDLRVNNAGNMSNGITTIQCMYAPEFTSHSEGARIKVE